MTASSRQKDVFPFERHVQLCIKAVEGGSKPTADWLVSELGGSKTDAVRALRHFWQVSLPARLGAHELPKPPTALQAAFQDLWEQAITAAGEQHTAAQAAKERQIAVLEAELSTSRELTSQYLAERDEQKTRAMRAEDQAREEKDQRQLHERLQLATREELALQVAKRDALADQLAAANARIGLLEADVARIEELEAALASTAADRDEAQARLKQLEETRQFELRSLKADHQTEKELLETQLANVRSELATAKAEMAQAQEEAKRHSADAAAAREALQQSSTQVTVLTTKLESTVSVLDAEKEARNNSDLLLGRALGQLDAANAARQSAEAALKEIQESAATGKKSRKRQGEGDV